MDSVLGPLHQWQYKRLVLTLLLPIVCIAASVLVLYIIWGASATTPTPTSTFVPTIEPPVINSFTVTPLQIVEGDHSSVRLAWSVSGDTTGIEIVSPAFDPQSELPAKGKITISLTSSTSFTLTAFGSTTVRTYSMRPE